MLNNDAALDGLFHALSDGARRTMLERLAEGPATVSELARPLDMSLPAVMQHLAVLERGGLVATEKVGRTRNCTLAPDAIDRAERWLGRQRRAWEDRLDRLEAFLADTEPPLAENGDEP